MQEKVSVFEAAKRLGISETAVRQRIHRKTLASGKDKNGRLVVYLSAADLQNNSHTDDTTQPIYDDSSTLTSDYIETLKSQIESLQQYNEALQRDKEHYREESRRKDTLLAQMNQTLLQLANRIPALEPSPDVSPDAPESPVTASEAETKGHTPPEPETAAYEPWWRRIFR